MNAQKELFDFWRDCWPGAENSKNTGRCSWVTSHKRLIVGLVNRAAGSPFSFKEFSRDEIAAAAERFVEGNTETN